MWSAYDERLDQIGHLDILFMLAKVKYWDSKIATYLITNYLYLITLYIFDTIVNVNLLFIVDKPAIHNALFRSKIYINRRIPQLLSF